MLFSFSSLGAELRQRYKPQQCVFFFSTCSFWYCKTFSQLIDTFQLCSVSLEVPGWYLPRSGISLHRNVIHLSDLSSGYKDSHFTEGCFIAPARNAHPKFSTTVLVRMTCALKSGESSQLHARYGSDFVPAVLQSTAVLGKGRCAFRTNENVART